MGRVIMPRIDRDEPPMIGLDRLSTRGQPKELTIKVSDSRTINLMLQLLYFIAEWNINEIGSKEATYVKDFLDEILRPEVGEKQKDSYMDYFNNFSGDKVNLKHTCLQLKSPSNYKLRLQFMYNLYELAYLHGLDPDLQRQVNDIGMWLEISSTEVRQAAFLGRKKYETTEAPNE